MKQNRELYYSRLIELADYISREEYLEPVELRPVKLVNVERNYNVTYNIQIFQSAFEDMPAIFPQWHWDEESGEPVLNGMENSVESVIDFFHLSLDEFMHLFGVKSQKTVEYWGRKLTESSLHIDVAKNIQDFVKLQRIRESL